MKWKVTAASARGSAHVRTGLPNQDACEFRNGDRSSALRAVLAVSDGHGGARHFRSQVGSALAVNTAIHVLYDALDAIMAESGAGLRQQPVEESVPVLAGRICEDWRASVKSDLENNPLTPAELEGVETAEGPAAKTSVEQDPVLAYGATLLATAVSDEFVLCLQLGDGDILTVDEAGRTARPMAADDRLVANQTTSLCQASAASEFRSSVLREFPAMVLVSTDGYANSFRSDADFMKIGADYLEIVRKQGIDSLAEELPGILSGASEEGSGDDITLGVMHRVGSGGSASSTGKMQAAKAPAPVAASPAPAGPSPAPATRSKTPVSWASVSRKNKAYWIGGALALTLGITFLILRYFAVCCSPPPQQQQQQKQPQAQAAGTAVKKASVVATPTPQPAKSAELPKDRAWQLEIEAADGGKLELAPGDKLLLPALQPNAEPTEAPYAEVRRNADGSIELVNLSDDPWTVQRPGKKHVDPPVGKGSGVLMESGIRITFRNGVSATAATILATRNVQN